MEATYRPRPVFGKVTRKVELPDFSLVESLYTPRTTMPRHTHELAHVSVVLRGAYTENYGLRNRACEPSVLVLHPPDEDHDVRFHDVGARVFSLHVKPGWLERVRDHSKVLDGPADFRGGPPVWVAVRLYRESREMDEVSPLMVESLALEIIATVSRHSRPVERKAPPWLGRFVEMLHTLPPEGVTLAGMAEAVGVHPVHLARQFRSHYRCTVGEYVRGLRVEAACRELSASDAPLSQVAFAAGFYDQSHLTNTLKRLTGMTPAQYRRAFRGR